MSIIREFSWCKDYGLECVKINIDMANDNITIFDSYKIKCIKHKLEVLDWARTYVEYEKCQMSSRFMQLAEWRAHNLLHAVGFQKDRTRSVDLNYDNKWYEKLGYFFLSLFYWGY